MNFLKLVAAGNDFVLIPEDGMRAAEPEKMAIRLCDRKTGIGADGLLVVRKISQNTVGVRHFNSDGSAAFCGNGSRCAAWFAHCSGMIKRREFLLHTSAGKLRAKVTGKEKIKLQIPDVKKITLHHPGRYPAPAKKVHFLNTGVPHAVVPVSSLDFDIEKPGRLLRFNPSFGKAGANIDFVTLKGGKILIRTYERGVEAETLACGTGAAAAAIALGLAGKVTSPVTCITASGEKLIVWFKAGKCSASDVCLEGPARIVFRGKI
ncbi:MAG: diaminopimelate epimerase [bacterium]